MESSLAEFERLLATALAAAPRPTVGTTHLAAGLVAGVIRIMRRTTLTDKIAELPKLTPEIADWILAVAREDVVAFRAPRSRSESEARPARIGGLPSSRDALADSSRRATMSAARLAASAGLAGITSSQIRKDAGLSRSDFDRNFGGVEECFLDAIESISTLAAETAETSAVGASSWEQRLYKEITALCTLAASDGALARMVLIEVLVPGRLGLLRREELIDRCTARLLTDAPPEKRPSDLVVDASIAAIWRIAEIEVAAGRASELPRIAPAFL